MNRLELLESRIGGRWTGVRFHYGVAPAGTLTKNDMRLCEAVAKSFDEPFVLSSNSISCPGARRSLRLTDDDEGLARTVAHSTGVSLDSVRKAVKATPQLESGVTAVTLGRQDSPDVAVSYTHPEVAMNLVRQWQDAHGESLTVELSTFMAICGNVVVAACKAGQIRLSFGCPTSRGCGFILPDALVVGMPYCMIDELFREHDDDAHL